MKRISYCTLHAFGLISIGLLSLTACHKDSLPPANPNVTGGVAAVVDDNFSLTLFSYAMTNLGYSDTLSGNGPFTLIAPSNTAFNAAGYTSGVAVINGADSMGRLLPYCMIRGNVKLDSLPYIFNQVLTGSSGLPLYVTHWANSRDTAIIVNGARISTFDKPATNGLVNIADAFIFPSRFDNVHDGVAGDANLSFFNAALNRSGMASQLEKEGPYTVFAPQNAAFTADGIPSTDSIYKMDPDSLKAFVQAHIVSGRNFIYDYILKADVTTNLYMEATESGDSIRMSLIADYSNPGRFTGISLSRPDGTNPATMVHSNVLAGNGVINTISALLKKDF